jgi:hypothetical protein
MRDWSPIRGAKKTCQLFKSDRLYKRHVNLAKVPEQD